MHQDEVANMNCGTPRLRMDATHITFYHSSTLRWIKNQLDVRKGILCTGIGGVVLQESLPSLGTIFAKLGGIGLTR